MRTYATQHFYFPLIKLCMTAAILAGSLGASPVSYAQTGTINLYSVTIQGVVLDRTFTRRGVIGIATRISAPDTINGNNRRELAFLSGNPGTNPEIGAIQFSTNTLLLGGTAALDMAFVRVSNNCVSARPDSRLSATGLNGFNAISGLTADFYQIFDGLIRVCLRNRARNLSGGIDVLGTGALFHSNTSYRATVSGRFIGSRRF